MSDPGCDRYRELASGFVDERLEAGELLDFEGHIEGCEACRDFEAGLRRVRQLLRAAAAIEPLRRPPPGFAAGVAARLAREVAPVAVPFPAPRTGRRPLRVLAGLAAAAAAVLFFAWSWERLLPRDASYAPVAVAFPGPRAGRRPLRALVGLAAAAAAALFFAWSWERLLPPADPAQQVVGRFGGAASPGPDILEDGSLDTWLREHALLARGGTILGPAEEFEFVSHRTAAGR